MNPTYYVLGLVFPLALWIAARLGQRRGERRGRQQRAAEDQQLIELARGDLQQLSTAVEAAREEVEAERGKVSRYFAKLQEFEGERNQWQQLYTEQSIGHGAAQDLMMRTIARLARQLQALGVAPKVPPVLQEIHEDFHENHVLPARQIQDTAPSAELTRPAPSPAVSREPGV